MPALRLARFTPSFHPRARVQAVGRGVISSTAAALRSMDPAPAVRVVRWLCGALCGLNKAPYPVRIIATGCLSGLLYGSQQVRAAAILKVPFYRAALAAFFNAIDPPHARMRSRPLFFIYSPLARHRHFPFHARFF